MLVAAALADEDGHALPYSPLSCVERSLRPPTHLVDSGKRASHGGRSRSTQLSVEVRLYFSAGYRREKSRRSSSVAPASGESPSASDVRKTSVRGSSLRSASSTFKAPFLSPACTRATARKK